MASISNAPIKETVYSGPAVETVYRGTSPASATGQTDTHTVYDPSRHQGRANTAGLTVNAGAARQSATPEVKRAAIRLFIIAALSFVQFIVFRETRPDTAIGGLIIAVMFCVLGIFAMRMSKAAFIIGILLYGADTAMWVL